MVKILLKLFMILVHSSRKEAIYIVIKDVK